MNVNVISLKSPTQRLCNTTVYKMFWNEHVQTGPTRDGGSNISRENQQN